MAPKVIRVLSLDGGGVRGLSSLIVLKTLLHMIEDELPASHKRPLLATDVFDIVVGTSTGGLIAIMLVKLNMTIDDCIEQYMTLSSQIFGQPSLLSRATMGFGITRYDGDLLRKYVQALIELRTNTTSGDLLTMEDDTTHRNIQISLVCREREDDWTEGVLDEPFFLCSHKCRRIPTGQTIADYATCKVCDAARATTAAPTYFPAIKLLNTVLVDGGYGHTNNPSKAAWDHYHASLTVDNQRTIWVNIGTGTVPEHSRHSTQAAPPSSPRPFYTRLLPKPILEMLNVTRDLQRIATDSEQPGREMRSLVRVAQGRLTFERFSANNGLHVIGLDAHNQLQDIERLTNAYLEDPDVRRRLQDTASAIAKSMLNDAVEEQSYEDGEEVHHFIPNEDDFDDVEDVHDMHDLEETENIPTLALTPSGLDVPELVAVDSAVEDEDVATPPPRPLHGFGIRRLRVEYDAAVDDEEKYDDDEDNFVPKQPRRISTSPGRLEPPVQRFVPRLRRDGSGVGRDAR